MCPSCPSCAGVGEMGCGNLDLLRPDAAFHHVYVESNCYYPVRDGPTMQRCLGNRKVLMLGDSTTMGLLTDAIAMWGQEKPFKNPSNYSDVCKYHEKYMPGRGGVHGSWTSHLCRGRDPTPDRHHVSFGGRKTISTPDTSYLRSPRCAGLGNLADRKAAGKFAAQLKGADVIIVHSCDHDLCNRGFSKPKLLSKYEANLKRLAGLFRKHASGKRILWLSCSAQSGLAWANVTTQTQLYKWRMDRLALEACRRHTWEFVDAFSLTSAALLQVNWWDHRGGLAGGIHFHSSCCPVGDRSEIAALAELEDQLPYRLAWQGGAGYISKMLAQVLFNQVCAAS